MKGQMKCHRVPFISFILLFVISTSVAVGCGGSSTSVETDPVYQAGYLQASKDTLSKVAQAKAKANTSFDEGYAAGYEEGKNIGYEEGINEVKDTPKDWDNEEIYEEGFVAGRELGYSEGLRPGYQAGYEQGAQAGYDSGYQDGFDSGYEKSETSGASE